jgi:hypothetical protein
VPVWLSGAFEVLTSAHRRAEIDMFPLKGSEESLKLFATGSRA